MQLKVRHSEPACSQPSWTGKRTGAVFVRQDTGDTLRVCNKRLGGGHGGPAGLGTDHSGALS